MHLTRVFSIAGLLWLAAVASLTAAEHTKDSLEAVKQNIDGKTAVLLDVREQSEWDEGHIDGAVLLSLSKLKEGDKGESLPKDRIIYAHCASGRRCLSAADLLKKQGFDVRPLKAGYMDLLKAGFPKSSD